MPTTHEKKETKRDHENTTSKINDLFTFAIFVSLPAV